MLQMEKWQVYLSLLLLVASIDPNFGTLSKSDKKYKVSFLNGSVPIHRARPELSD